MAVGLNLSGVFEVGGGIAGLGDDLTQGDSYHASFFTGVLTTLVATPCTAPFMAAGRRCGADPVRGDGADHLRLPRVRPVAAVPGAVVCAVVAGAACPSRARGWTRSSRFFAFPMYASAAWLLWVLAQQTSSLGLAAALAGTVLLGLAAWAYQKSKEGGTLGHKTAVITAVVAVVLAAVLPSRIAQVAVAQACGAALGHPPTAGSPTTPRAWPKSPLGPARTRQFHGELVPHLPGQRAQCVRRLRGAGDLRGKAVTLMKGDWTNRDPAITQALAAFGRGGVPLYLVYNAKPGTHEPLVLPQLLTPTIVQRAFADVASPDSR